MFKELLEDVLDMLFHFRKGLSRIAQNRNIWHGLVIFLVINLLVSLATMKVRYYEFGEDIAFIPPLYAFFSPELIEVVLRSVPLVNLLLQLVFSPLFFFLTVGVLSLVAELFGGRSSISSLGAVLGYGHFPYLLLALGGLLSRYGTLNLIGFLTLVAFLWSLFLKIAGLKIVYNFSWSRAVLCYFMPLISLLVALFLFLLLVIVFLIPLFMQILEGYNSLPSFFKLLMTYMAGSP